MVCLACNLLVLRSSLYTSCIAKINGCPIIRVNADYPEVRAGQVCSMKVAQLPDIVSYFSRAASETFPGCDQGLQAGHAIPRGVSEGCGGRLHLLSALGSQRAG